MVRTDKKGVLIQNSLVVTFGLGVLALALLLFLELALVLCGGFLVLLVLGNEVVHIGLGFGELHLVHAFAGVPVEEGLAPEHGSELLGDALEELLDGSGVSNEGGGHLETTGRDVADSSLDVVRDPLDEVGRVLVLDVEHLLVDLLHGHAAPEHGGDGQVPEEQRAQIRTILKATPVDH